MFEFDKDFQKKDEDTFHFVAYVPVNGRLYELDGLKEGPVDLGKCEQGQEWLKSVKPILDKRIQRLVSVEGAIGLPGVCVTEAPGSFVRVSEGLWSSRSSGSMELLNIPRPSHCPMCAAGTHSSAEMIELFCTDDREVSLSGSSSCLHPGQWGHNWLPYLHCSDLWRENVARNVPLY